MADSKVRANMLNLSGDYPFTGSVTGHVADGSITAAKLSGTISASKLTGALPALDGSALTGLAGITTSASDPLVTTNPAGGVGTLWANTTSGEMFVCTDATAGANVWYNVGAGTGDVQPWVYAGTSYGYTYGSQYPNNAGVDQHSFTTDGNSVDVANMNQLLMRWSYAGHSSATNGYCSGGSTYPNTEYATQIDTFAFASLVDMTAHGDLSQGRHFITGTSSATRGYTASGMRSGGKSNVIDSFLFANNVTSGDWGDLDVETNAPGGVSSEDYGYCYGGQPSGYISAIHKWQNATQSAGTNVGDLSVDKSQNGGVSSVTHGYSVGGYTGSPSNIIDRWAFVSDGLAGDVGDLSLSRYGVANATSTTSGYTMGGDVGSGGSSTNRIDKFSTVNFVTCANIGTLTGGTSSYMGMGSQH
mgnify:CR=1 FL=1